MTKDPKAGHGDAPEGGEAGRPRGRSGRPRRPAKAKPEKRGGSVEERKEDRLKRLLDLVVLLLNAREPVPFAALAEQFEAYQGKGPSALRTFERDKAGLLALGIPLHYQGPTTEDPEGEGSGYSIDRRAYLLPPVRFTQDELAALVAGAAITRAHPGLPYADAVESALSKVSFDAPEVAEAARATKRDLMVHLPAAEHSPVEAEVLAVLEAAARQRKRVTLVHRPASSGLPVERVVDPYGLVYRQGAWVLVGWCHLRKDLRSFRLDRVLEARPEPKPTQEDFERPVGIDLRAIADRSPWRFDVHEPIEVVLRVGEKAHGVVEEDLGNAVVQEDVAAGAGGEGSWVRLRFRCGNTPYLLERVRVSLGGLVLEEPRALVDELLRELEEVAAASEAEGTSTSTDPGTGGGAA